ncbi:response regulator [Paenibacillus sp. FSL W7-1287]|uniref:response regulator n=1 Tax=Paenibacillus sp. FSL W7-1287 TaxID=2954538 RepID=UPI0030F5F485
MKAIIIDDEQIALDVIEIFLGEIGGVTVVGKYKRVRDALNDAVSLQPDLIILDIEMPEQNGLSAAERLKQSCPSAEIIFATAHANYAVEAFDREALAYLLKPVDKQRLAKAVARASMLLTGKSTALVQGTEAAQAEQLKHEDSTVTPLKLKTLGSLELYTTDGKLIKWRTKKTKELFAYLWHHQGNPVYKYAILDDLWQEYSAQQAQRLFHTTVYYLRSMFKAEGYPEILSYGDERYWLNLSVLSSDIDQLATLSNDHSLESRITDLKSILSLYGGDYFEKEHYTWAVSRKMTLHTDYVNVLLRLKKISSKEDQIMLLYKLIELDSDNERYYDELTSCLEEQGETTGAKQVQRMKEELQLS